jgi:CheY-like chemotaxis protein
MNILLVEDNPADARLVREAFKEVRVAADLFWARDGVEALDFLRHHGEFWDAPLPDLILLDLNLPRLNGCEVLQQVKLDPALLNIPVVMLSSSNAKKDVLDSYAAHANSFHTKPADFDEFMALVRLIDAYWLGASNLPTQP